MKDQIYPTLEFGTVKNLELKKNRPTIFVGSSIESKIIAEKLREFFPKEEFELDVWYDGIFGRTRSSNGDLSNMEWLKNFTDIYDFAIFIFVPEDRLISVSRKDTSTGLSKKAMATRHNVVFEYGMFLGRVGAKRSFIIFDNEVKNFVDEFFSDLKENLNDPNTRLEINEDFRIELYGYKGNYQGYRKSLKKQESTHMLPYEIESFTVAANQIKTQIIKNYNNTEISFLPATVLAFGYYNNFIDIFVRNVNYLKSDSVYPENWIKQNFTKNDLENLRAVIQHTNVITLKIVIPTSLELSKQDNFVGHFDKRKFKEVVFPGKNRSITLLQHIRPPDKEYRKWIIYDIPTTLNSSIEAIEEITKHENIRELLREKELRNFRKSIEKKIEKAKNTSGTENIAKIIDLITFDQFIEETSDQHQKN